MYTYIQTYIHALQTLVCMLLVTLFQLNVSYLLLDYVQFSELVYVVYEDDGPVYITLQLQKPAVEEITIEVHSTPITATGEFLSYYLAKTLSNS